MNWLVLTIAIYYIFLLFISILIVIDNKPGSKESAYLLLVIFFPVIGILIYLFFGINSNKKRIYTKKLLKDDIQRLKFEKWIYEYSKYNLERDKEQVGYFSKLAKMLLYESKSLLTDNNSTKIYINGEEKFPDLITDLQNARKHIHIQYYIYEDDSIGNQIAEILIQKAREGVIVRMIYDAFGSKDLHKKLIDRLNKAGVECYPFHVVTFAPLANRLNYRNHRKSVIIDGSKGYLGGINISDKYINKPGKDLYWRDTHIRITGSGSWQLQHLFLCDWNFCANQSLEPEGDLFANPEDPDASENQVVQIASSGPDSLQPTILYAILQSIYLSREEILITTPYFIPDRGLLNALCIAADSGVDVKLLVPGISDSFFINIVCSSFYEQLILSGIEVYQYHKGFIHAKTMICDRRMTMIGTANLDQRSFDLNFEVNAVIYDDDFSQKMARIFEEDLKDARPIDIQEWRKRPIYYKILEFLARLVAPLL